MSASSSEKSILVATVGRPHGVHGLVHLFASTEDSSSVEKLGLLRDEQGRSWRVQWRGAGIALLTDAHGVAVSGRDQAAQLVNLKLYVERERLPEAEENEFYHADLIGARAVSDDGAELGTVRLVHDYGAGVSLEISGGPRDLIVPFTRACVPDVDLSTGRIVVRPPHEVEVEGDLSGADDVAVRA